MNSQSDALYAANFPALPPADTILPAARKLVRTYRLSAFALPSKHAHKTMSLPPYPRNASHLPQNLQRYTFTENNVLAGYTVALSFSPIPPGQTSEVYVRNNPASPNLTHFGPRINRPSSSVLYRDFNVATGRRSGAPRASGLATSGLPGEAIDLGNIQAPHHWKRLDQWLDQLPVHEWGTMADLLGGVPGRRWLTGGEGYTRLFAWYLENGKTTPILPPELEIMIFSLIG